MPETWLYENGDEAYIDEMTPSGYVFKSLPSKGSRGGGIAFVVNTSIADCFSFLVQSS